MPRVNLVDREKKIVISVNYKCASAQIIRWFRGSMRDYKHENTSVSNIINRQYVFSDKYLQNYPTYFKILVVRDPFSRVVSAFLDKGFHNFKPLKNLCASHNQVFEDLTFSKFVDMIQKTEIKYINGHWRPLSFDNNPKIYDRIVKIEYLKKNMDQIAKKYEYNDFPKIKKTYGKEIQDLSNVPIKDLKNMPESVVQNYTNYYTPEIIKIISNVYADDLKLFNYSYEKFANKFR